LLTHPHTHLTHSHLTHTHLTHNRLYATYFEGDAQSPRDDEARILLEKWLPASRVLPFDKADNFWEMGATGPCGPCIEIHYDRIGGGRDAAKLVNADLPDVIEIWNNVFMSYNREADGSLRNLPAQHIDTGMGFERLSSILQGFDSNYDTDIFTPIFHAIQMVTGARPYAGKIGAEDEGFVDMAYRVVADHVRTLTFAIADGAVPSNDGRGYVLRRVLRRAVRYGRQNLGAELGFFSKLVPTLVDHMGEAFPEIVRKKDYVMQIISEEETSFSRTIDIGIKEFNARVDANCANGEKFSGSDAHFLFTSMGFPVDLTELMCEERGIVLDMEGYEAKMKEEKELSAAAHRAKMSGGSGKDMTLQAEQTARLVSTSVAITDDSAKYVWDADLASDITACFVGRGETEDKVGFQNDISSSNSTCGLILNATNFYAESGGQIYDQGKITTADGSVFRVDNVQVFGGFVLHLGEVLKGSFAVGNSATLSVNYTRRSPIAANHTMTHVLNYALRDVLIGKENIGVSNYNGPAVDQKGSLVDESKFRFDFSWSSSVAVDKLAAVEALCQDKVSQGLAVQAYVAPLDNAQQISALRAVFGEKYPDPVRIISVCDTPIPEILAKPTEEIWKDFSIEFCGGTHLSNTSEAQKFVITNEEGIAKGIRRITGFTQERAREAINTANGFAMRCSEVEKLEGALLVQEVKKLTLELATLEISVVAKADLNVVLKGMSARCQAWTKGEAAKKVAAAGAVAKDALTAAKAAGANKSAVRFDFGVNGKDAQGILKAITKEFPDMAVMLVTADYSVNKFACFAQAPNGVAVDCKAWTAAAVEGLGGKGGGKANSAQISVDGVDNVGAALAKAQAF
jgi:alanyl-tRNA synthetase